MEAIMKRTTWATALLLAILMIVGFGCSTDKSSVTGGGNGDVGTVQVYVYADTVKFIPGDSAQAPGFVVVTDRNGRVMRGVEVVLSLTPPTIGILEYANVSLRDTTNDQGRVEFYFRSYARPGRVTITAFVGTISGSDSLVVLESSSIVRSLTIALSKPVLRVSPVLEDSTQVTVTIKDSSNAGIPSISLRLNATGGRFPPLSATDSTGRAQTWWYNDHEFGTFTICVTVADLVRCIDVTVDSVRGVSGTLRLTTSSHNVRADGCISRAVITASLKDQYSTAVVGDTIIFSTVKGSVNARGVTDSLGNAVAYYCNYADPSVDPLDSAMVVARHERWGLFDTVRIYVETASQVGLVAVAAGRNIGVAGVDSSSITVNAFYEDNTRVEGLWARFYSTCGQFTLDSVLLTNGTHSQQPVSWKFCNHTTTSVNPAKIWVTVGGVTSDTLRMIVNAGPPRAIDVVAPPVIPMNEQLTVTASVWDSLGNSVGSGVAVVFSSTLGTLSPTSPISTDDNGIAEARLWPGTEAGQAVIKATVGGVYMDSTVTTILPDQAGTILLEVPYPSPQVQGTGGQDWTQIIAYVKDVHGNAVQDGLWVTFTILAQPGGCTINGHGLTDSAQTAAGAARVTFNSGTVPGPVNIQACTIIEGQPRCVNATNISVVAGPPAHITIQATDVGVDVDGVAWDVKVGALVGDLYNNPVRDGIAVFFDVVPEIALILSDTVITGNGTHQAGIAFTVLRYPSDHTFDHVQITARTADPNAVTATIDYILPLQTPTISLNADPATWHYAISPGWCRIKLMCIVKDQHNRPISGATVCYSTTRGRFWTTSAHTLEQNWQYTGPAGNPNFAAGYCELWLCEQAQYIFPPNTTEITADIQVEVQGYGAIDGTPINFRQ
jgi:hypothetical protein